MSLLQNNKSLVAVPGRNEAGSANIRILILKVSHRYYRSTRAPPEWPILPIVALERHAGRLGRVVQTIVEGDVGIVKIRKS